MSDKGGRPRTFPLAIVPVALELREREGGTWTEIARELKVHPATLRARAAEYRRIFPPAVVCKTPASGSGMSRTGEEPRGTPERERQDSTGTGPLRSRQHVRSGRVVAACPIA